MGNKVITVDQRDWQEIVYFECIHSYYRDGLCKSLSFKPTKRTAQIMTALNLLHLPFENGFKVLIHKAKRQYLKNTVYRNQSLSFVAESIDPNFWKFTETTELPNPDKVFHFAFSSTNLASTKIEFQGTNSLIHVLPSKFLNGFTKSNSPFNIYLPYLQGGIQIDKKQILRIHDQKNCTSLEDFMPDQGYQIQDSNNTLHQVFWSSNVHSNIAAILEFPLHEESQHHHNPAFQLKFKAKEVYWRYTLEDISVVNQLMNLKIEQQ